jgi:virulence-associated protein VapD
VVVIAFDLALESLNSRLGYEFTRIAAADRGARFEHRGFTPGTLYLGRVIWDA